MFFAVAAHKKNRVFVTMPRFQEGIPVTLGVVTDKKLNNNPIISPYPSWEWHKNPGSCGRNRIVSVYRVLVSRAKKSLQVLSAESLQIDECQRLWVLDTGRLLEEQTCPPQILAFDLQTVKTQYKSVKTDGALAGPADPQV
jgi:hypothetical protein